MNFVNKIKHSYKAVSVFPRHVSSLKQPNGFKK